MAIGVTIMGVSALSNIGVFLVANLLGGVAAALLFNALDLGDDHPAEPVAIPDAQTVKRPVVAG